ncbi:MAG: HAMP domain-containing sensor histidine kinase [Candidatus Sericytochromatia bacterium]|nr:HAMP domain-containing sensor histidine kinase [Candidatus Sericytochromatia bacterium]
MEESLVSLQTGDVASLPGAWRGRMAVSFLVSDGAAVRRCVQFDGASLKGDKRYFVWQLWRLASLRSTLFLDLNVDTDGAGEVRAWLTPVSGSAWGGEASPEAAVQLFGELVTLIDRAHEVGVVGLRPTLDSLLYDSRGQWRLLAPDFEPQVIGEDGPHEHFRRQDWLFLCEELEDVSRLAGRPLHLENALKCLRHQEPGEALALLGFETAPRMSSELLLTRNERERTVEVAGDCLLHVDKALRPQAVWLLTSDIAMRRALADTCAHAIAQALPVRFRTVLGQPEEGLRDLIPGWPAPHGASRVPSETVFDPVSVYLSDLGQRAYVEACMEELAQGVAEHLDVLFFPDVSTLAASDRLLLDEILSRSTFRHVICLLGAPEADEGIAAAGPELRPEEGSLAQEAVPKALVKSLRPATTDFSLTSCDVSRVRAVQSLWQSVHHQPRWPDEVVRELMLALQLAGGWASFETLMDLMDMPVLEFFQALARAIDSAWLVCRGRGITFFASGDGFRIENQATFGDRMRWQRRIAALPSVPASRRVFAALAAGADADFSVALSLTALEAHSLGRLKAFARLVAPVSPGLLLEQSFSNTFWVLLALANFDAPNSEHFLLAQRVLGETSEGQGWCHWFDGRRALSKRDFGAARAGFLESLNSAPALRDLLCLELAPLEKTRWSDASPDETRALPRTSQWPSTYWTPAISLVVEGWGVWRRLEDGTLAPEVAWLEGSKFREAAARWGLWQLLGDLLGAIAASAISRERYGVAAEAYSELRALTARHSIERERVEFEELWAVLQTGSLERAQQLLVEWTPPEQTLLSRALSQLVAYAGGGGADPIPTIRAAWRESAEIDDAVWGERLLVSWADVLLFQGRLAELFESAPFGSLDAEAVPRGIGLRRAEAYLRDGALFDARALLEVLWAEAAWESAPGLAARWHWLWARLHLARGQVEVAREALVAAAEWSRLAGTEALDIDIALIRGKISGLSGARSEPQQHFEYALNLAESLPAPHHRALVLVELAGFSESDEERLALLEQARAHFAVWVDPLGPTERQIFLGWPERAAAWGAMQASFHEAGAENSWASRPSLLEFLEVPPSFSEVLKWLQGTLRAQIPVSRILVYLRSDEGKLSLVDGWAEPGGTVALDSPLPFPHALERVATEKASLWVHRELEFPSWMSQEVFLGAGLEGLLLVPLCAPPARAHEMAWGVVYVESGHAWSELTGQLKDTVRAVTAAAGLVLRCLHNEEDARRKDARVAFLNSLNQALAGAMDMGGLLQLALEQVLKVTEGEQGFVFFGDDFACRASLDCAGGRPDPSLISRTILSRVLQARKALTILDVGQDQELLQTASLMLRNVRSVMCVPLLLDETLLGALYVSSSSANRTFAQRDLDVLTAIAAQVALMLQNVQAFDTIRELNQSLEEKVRQRTEELERTLHELVQIQDQLLESEKLATVGTLAAGVAHEINNPLGAVLVNAQMLRLELTDPSLLESVALIEDGAQRCKEIVEALLSFSKVKQSPSEEIDVARVVREAIDLVSLQASFRDIDLNVVGGPVPGALGSESDLRQVIVQLLMNAAYAVREREIGLRCVRVNLLREWNGIVIAVSDTGSGIPVSLQRRVFDPFYTTKGVGEGKGLGLSVCRRIIERLGGSLTLESQEGEGSTFRILLPSP